MECLAATSCPLPGSFRRRSCCSPEQGGEPIELLRRRFTPPALQCHDELPLLCREQRELIDTDGDHQLPVDRLTIIEMIAAAAARRGRRRLDEGGKNMKVGAVGLENAPQCAHGAERLAV